MSMNQQSSINRRWNLTYESHITFKKHLLHIKSSCFTILNKNENMIGVSYLTIKK